MTSSIDMPLVRLTRNERSVIDRPIAVEAPVAIEVNGLGYSVMMMTPAALDEFATGFMLTERLADAVDDIVDVDCFESAQGWIVRVTLAERCAGRIHDRVRHRSSDTGCGLCGIAGLEQVVRSVPGTPPLPQVGADVVFAALYRLRAHQPINALTGAVHAAALCDADGEAALAYEDVGRHNALDKLIGAMARGGHDPAAGFLLVTSRISFEMVDKALIARAPLLVGISAPTSLAIAHAERHGLTLIALARRDAMLVANDPGGLFTKEVVAEEGLEPPTRGL
jgi:FdhD protein